MTTIELGITFNQPFRVATGHGQGDVDDVINRENPLPSTSLKGVIRDAARLLLPGSGRGKEYRDHHLVEEVFGGPGHHDVIWHFSDASLTAVTDESYRARTRVSIDEHRRARPGALYAAEELHVMSATAEIRQIGLVPPERKPLHLALLHVAARLVDGVGSDKRRGLGWVTISTNATDDEIRTMVETIVRSEA